ncbi:unnamed protein product [Colias eurytheme]|nr:unnamed protein product [Colias eurytheme]
MTSQWEGGVARAAQRRAWAAPPRGLGFSPPRRLLLLSASTCCEFMESGFGEVESERDRRIASMAASLEVMHPLDPPQPDVLLALLARNKALEVVTSKAQRSFDICYQNSEVLSTMRAMEVSTRARCYLDDTRLKVEVGHLAAGPLSGIEAKRSYS